MEKSQKITILLQKIGKVIILTFFYVNVFGQTNLPIWFQKISPQIGFSQAYNYHVLQDSSGFVWVSSTNGLNRFDGQRVKLYSPDEKDSTSLYDGSICGKFFETPKGNIWFSSSKAIHQYHRKTDHFSRYFLKNHPRGSTIRDYKSFNLEKDKFLWIKTQDGIYRYDTHLNTDSFIINTGLYYVKPHVNESGKLTKIFNYGGGKGLDLIDLEKSIAQKVKSETFQKQTIFNLIYINDSMIWLSTSEEGLVAWNPKSDSRIEIEEFKKYNFKDQKCSFSRLDEKSIIIIVENQDVYKYNLIEDIMEPISYRVKGQKENMKLGLFGIYIDNNKNIWVSDRVNGLAYARWGKSKFASISKFSSQKNTNSYSFRTLVEGENDIIWCATKNAGIFKYDLKQGKAIRQFDDNNGLPSDVVYDILRDKKDRIFAATQKGLAMSAKGNYFSKIRIENSDNTQGYFTSIIQLSGDQEILVTDIEEGIFKLIENNEKPELIHFYKYPESVEYENLFEDSKGNILITFLNKGIGIFNYQKRQLVFNKELSIAAPVTSLWEDEYSQELWIATTNGLMKISTKNDYEGDLQKITAIDPSLGKIFKTILPGNTDFLWLGTNNGLARVNKKTLAVQKFGLADGIQSTDFYSGLKRKNGDLWFGGFDGITIVPSSKIDSIKNIPSLKITNIQINDLDRNDLICEKTQATNVTEIQHLARPYSDNTITLEFTALEFSDPNSNQLEFQLMGLDNNPVRLKKGEYGFARYPNLRPDTYIFKLRGANSDGEWSEFEEVLTITIQPPFTQTMEFYILITLLISGLIYGIYRYRIAQIKKTEMLNTRIAKNKMSALRAQMNPHFIYNSMQTVNGIISRKDTMGAVKYINKFSRLMRMILENSRVGKVSIEKEIGFLTSYMEIEKRRFQNPFDYNITVDDEVDTFDTEIPSMLTQPFVENAIKHGLFHKKEKGIIDIKFIRENGSLKCIIEDNGVGRAKTSVINTQSGRTHQSRGLQIVNERLQLIRQSNPGNYKVKITDLFDLEQNASGTRVEITLPFGG